VLGPTFVPSRERGGRKPWRVILVRPLHRYRKRCARWAATPEEGARLATLSPESFLESAPFAKVRYGRPHRVYFIRWGSYGPIKIGRAVDVVRRLNGLQAANWVELRLLGATSDVDEKQMHRRFSHLHIRGEWFRAETDLLVFIESSAQSSAFPGDCRNHLLKAL
jgi:hypothetical protein